MSDREPQSPDEAGEPGEGSVSGRPPEEESAHESFVQRLHSHFGRDVDPEIRLHAPDEDDSAAPSGEGSGESSASLGLVRKLAGHGGAGRRYELKREIARGGMGTVVRVWDDDLRRNLAMKVLHSKGRFDDDSDTPGVDHEKLMRFLEEAQITGQLDHPGIVPVHDLGIDDQGRCYFTMRLVRGRELKDVLDDARKGAGGMTLTKAVTLLLKVCESMAFAHAKRVVHRDLKPSNVMVGRYGEVYVMDWGLARVLGKPDQRRAEARRKPRVDESSLSLVRTVRKEESEQHPDSPLVTMDGDVVGTPSFMAIEQARGKLDEVGPRSDVYSLGAILYYMLTGRAPYVEPGERVSPHTVLNRVLQGSPTPVRKLAGTVPAELIAICEKAMSRDAADRYASMEEVAEDLQAFLEDRVVRAYEGGSLAEFRKWIVRNKGVAAALALLLVVALTSVSVFALQKQKRAAELAEQQDQLLAAKDAADASAAEARQNLILAEDRELESKKSSALAEEKRREAERSSYIANVTAADYSLRLDDIAESRARLTASNTLLREWEWDHLRGQAWPALESFLRDQSRPTDRLRWSADGASLYVLSRDGYLRFLDARDGSQVRAPMPLPIVTTTTFGALTPMTFSPMPGGGRVAIVGSDARVRVFDVAAGRELFALPARNEVVGHGSRVGAVAVSRDGRHLVSGADNGSLLLWSAEGELVRRFPPHSGAVTDLSWSPDSTRFASSSLDGSIRLWDVEDGQQVGELLGHQDAVWSIVWDDTGETLYSGGAEGLVNRWSVLHGRLTASFSGHRDGVRAVDHDPLTGHLVSGSDDRTVRLWDVERGELAVLRGHEEPVLDVAFSPDGRLVASSSESGMVKLWDARGDLTTTDLVFHEERITQAVFSPDDRLVASADESGELVLWDALAGLPLRRLRGHTDSIVALAFAPDGRHLFSASRDGSVRRWAVESGAEVGVYGHDQPLTGLLVMPEGDRLLTAGLDERVRVFAVEEQTLLAEYVGHDRELQALALRPGSEHFAGIGKNNVVLQDVMGRGRLLEPLHRPSYFSDCAFAPDGARLVTVSMRGEVCLWDVETGRLLEVRRDHTKSAHAVAFHPGGERFATGAWDGTVRVRTADTAESVLVLRWPEERVTSLAFSHRPDGARLLAGAEDGSLRIWESGQVHERRRRWAEMSELDDRAAPLVDRLFDDHFFLREVRNALQRDRELDPELREAALRHANFRGDDPTLLFERTLAESVLPGQDQELYAHALHRVEAAASMSGGDRIPAVQLALGVAAFRNGLEEQAMEALERARRLSEDSLSSRKVRRLTAPEETVRLLFLAMSQEACGRGALAARSLALAVDSLDNDPELAAWRTRLAEARLEAEREVGRLE